MAGRLPILVKLLGALGLGFLISEAGALAQGPVPPLFSPNPFELVPPDGPRSTSFGHAVDLSSDGQLALVGAAPVDCDASDPCGTAYVFRRNLNDWFLEAKLIPSDPVESDGIGAVALSGSGEVALVGVPGVDCEAGANCGAVYVFVKGPEGWSQRQKLVAADPENLASFGVTLALTPDGGTVLVGANGVDCGAFFSCGAVYAFEQSGGIWIERQKISPPVPQPSGFFGGGLDLAEDGRTALIGGNYNGGLTAGSVFVFTRAAGGTWVQETSLEPPGIFQFLGFGFSLEVSGDGSTAIIHAANIGAIFNEGTAFVFARSGGVWSLQDQFTSSPFAGVALSADGNRALVSTAGRPCDGCVTVTVHQRTGGDWNEVQSLTTPDLVDPLAPAPLALASDGRTALLGLRTANCSVAGRGCGSAFIFAGLPAAFEVPTLGEWGLILLAFLLATSGAALLARRRRSGGLTPAR